MNLTPASVWTKQLNLYQEVSEYLLTRNHQKVYSLSGQVWGKLRMMKKINKWKVENQVKQLLMLIKVELSVDQIMKININLNLVTYLIKRKIKAILSFSPLFLKKAIFLFQKRKIQITSKNFSSPPNVSKLKVNLHSSQI